MAIPTVDLISQIDFLDPACFTPGGTVVTDLSGNGNNWELQNTSYTYNATFGTLSLPTGNALQSDNLNFYVGNVPFTYSYWFYYAGGGPENRYFYNGSYPSAAHIEQHTNVSVAGELYWYTNGLTVLPAALTPGQYHNICSTYDGTTWNGYINNVLVVSGSGPINQAQGAYPGFEFNLAAYNPGGVPGLGLIYFYDAALNSTDRNLLYNDGYARFNPPATPVASYSPFDNASYPGTGNTWFDLSVNNNDLVLSNQTFATSPVKSFSFANGYANDPTPTNLPTNIFTIDAWIKFNSTSQQIVYGAGKDVGGGGQAALLVYKFPGVNGGKPFVDMGSGVGQVYFNLDPVIGQWYNITWSADGTTTRLYVDGVLDNSGAQGGQIGATSSGIILGQLIGGSGGPSGLYYSDASFGQFNIYNEALDAGTILQNYEDTKNQYVLPTVEYDFQNGSYPGVGTTITDLQGANTNLTVGNGHWVSGTPNYFDLQGDTNLFNTSPGGSFSSTTFTVNCWYNPLYTNPGTYASVWSLGIDGNPTSPVLSTNSDGTLNIQWSFGYGLVGTTVSNGWHLISFVSNGSTTTLYVDGISIGSVASSSGSVASPYTIRLGSGSNSSNNPWLYAYGKIGYWSYFDVALDAADILAIYNATSGSYAPPPPLTSNVGGRQFAQGFNG
jgi:hypothetical protein